VFSLLIVPAVVGSIFSDRLPVRAVDRMERRALRPAPWVSSDRMRSICRPAPPWCGAGGLPAAGRCRESSAVRRPSSSGRRNLRTAIDALATAVLIALLVSSAWLMIVPTGDQPILVLVESATGIGPTRFLGAVERDAYESAARDAVRSRRSGSTQ
jgi:hypothetical protein